MKRNWRSVAAAVVIAILTLVLWDELQDLGAELYRLFS
jgi:hypothetical protein